ncbi:MAG TPA: hypothetical protein PKL52_07860 [Tenuifilaceae bacterium]|nr:hypothetical protein [Tenuifilaceae bacterium]
MKKIKFLSLLAIMALLFAACETVVEDPAGPRGVAPVPGIVNLNPATFDVLDLENTFIKFTLVLEGSGVSQANILASFKGNKQRVNITSVSSFPSDITITLAEVVNKLGMVLDSIKPADLFNFEVQTVVGGKTYYSSAAFNVAVVCGYDVANVTGSYYVVTEDWGSEGPVTITADPDDDYIVYVSGLAAMDGVTEDLGPLKMVIDPLTFKVTAVKTVLASIAFGYHNFSYAGSGELNTCDGTYVMYFAITVDEGSFGGPFEFVFTKQ